MLTKPIFAIIICLFMITSCGRAQFSPLSENELPEKPHQTYSSGYDSYENDDSGQDNCEGQINITVNRPEAYSKGQLDVRVMYVGETEPLPIRGPNGYQSKTVELTVDDVTGGEYLVEVWSEGLRFYRHITFVEGDDCRAKDKSLTVDMEVFKADDAGSETTFDPDTSFGKKKNR